LRIKEQETRLTLQEHDDDDDDDDENLQGALKQKGVKQTEIKHALWRRLIFNPVLQSLRLVPSNSSLKHEMATHYGR